MCLYNSTFGIQHANIYILLAFFRSPTAKCIFYPYRESTMLQNGRCSSVVPATASINQRSESMVRFGCLSLLIFKMDFEFCCHCFVCDDVTKLLFKFQRHVPVIVFREFSQTHNFLLIGADSDMNGIIKNLTRLTEDDP
jgi:hypothetical protein